MSFSLFLGRESALLPPTDLPGSGRLEPLRGRMPPPAPLGFAGADVDSGAWDDADVCGGPPPSALACRGCIGATARASIARSRLSES